MAIITIKPAERSNNLWHVFRGHDNVLPAGGFFEGKKCTNIGSKIVAAVCSVFGWGRLVVLDTDRARDWFWVDKRSFENWSSSASTHLNVQVSQLYHPWPLTSVSFPPSSTPNTTATLEKLAKGATLTGFNDIEIIRKMPLDLTSKFAGTLFHVLLIRPNPDPMIQEKLRLIIRALTLIEHPGFSDLAQLEE